MAEKKVDKTNAMRLLDSAKIEYSTYSYEKDGKIDGVSVANKIDKPVELVFKTLVTQGASKNYFVFIIPVAQELDLKAAAKAVNEKSIEMIKVSDITKITGYIRGGCSPLAMKKSFKTVVDKSCDTLETIVVSAGKIGAQIELKPNDLLSLLDGYTENICK